MIDANGGELTSADGTLRLTIPAGALSTATDIAIQPISNELTGGIGDAYRLTPHGQTFSKPVTITFNYNAADTVGSRPEFLDIAFQDAEGSWQIPNLYVAKLISKSLVLLKLLPMAVWLHAQYCVSLKVNSSMSVFMVVY